MVSPHFLVFFQFRHVWPKWNALQLFSEKIILELRVYWAARFAGFASCCCQDAKTPPKRVERSTVKLIALFKDHHGVLGVPAGCGVGKSWVFTRRFTPVAELIFAVDYGGMLVIENQGES